MIEKGDRVKLTIPPEMLDMSEHSVTWEDNIRKLDGAICKVNSARAYRIDLYDYDGHFISPIHNRLGGIWAPDAWLEINYRQGFLLFI